MTFWIMRIGLTTLGLWLLFIAPLMSLFILGVEAFVWFRIMRRQRRKAGLLKDMLTDRIREDQMLRDRASERSKVLGDLMAMITEGMRSSDQIRPTLQQIIDQADPRLCHPDTWPTESDKVLREAIQAYLDHWGVTVESASEHQIEQLWSVRQFALGLAGDRAPNVAPIDIVSGLDHRCRAARLRERADRELDGKASQALSHMVASGQIRKPKRIRDLPGPDIHLWHDLATETHDFDEWETDIWWILEQPDCDKASVAEFLANFVHYEFLEIAAMDKDLTRLGKFNAVLERWNAGFYRHWSLPVNVEVVESDWAGEVAEIGARYGVEIAEFPEALTAFMAGQMQKPLRHIPSGWRFGSTQGLIPTARAA